MLGVARYGFSLRPISDYQALCLQRWQWENGEKEEVKLNMELLPLIINGLSLYGCNLELPQVTGSLGRLDYMLVSKDLTTVDLWPSNLSGDGRGIEEWFNLVAAHEKNFCDEFARTTVGKAKNQHLNIVRCTGRLHYLCWFLWTPTKGRLAVDIVSTKSGSHRTTTEMLVGDGKQYQNVVFLWHNDNLFVSNIWAKTSGLREDRPKQALTKSWQCPPILAQWWISKSKWVGS